MRTRPLALLGAAAVSIPLIVAGTVVSASADGHAPLPIAVEPLTPRSVVPDDVSMKFKIHHPGEGSQVVDLSDPSRVAVARITVQPGARFPAHTHPGPVLVTVAEGQLTYVDQHTCVERVYSAGTAFMDAGHDVHSAYGSSPGVTTLIATFFAAPASGPLTIAEPASGKC